MKKRDQLSVSDTGLSGWVIEGYPIPLTECEAEEIASLSNIIDSLQKQVELLEECVDFYANGGNSNRDIWYDEKLGYFIGKRARETKKKLEELRSEGWKE